jgi:hypothetical protein
VPQANRALPYGDDAYRALTDAKDPARELPDGDDAERELPDGDHPNGDLSNREEPRLVWIGREQSHRPSLRHMHVDASTHVAEVHATPPLHVSKKTAQYVSHHALAHVTVPLHDAYPEQQIVLASAALVTSPAHAKLPWHWTSHVPPAQLTSCEHALTPHVIAHEPASQSTSPVQAE